MMTPQTLLYLLLSMALLSSCGVYREMSLEHTDRPTYDAVIVPGFPFDNEHGEMNMFHRMRLFWAYHLYSTGETRNIIVSGGAVHSPYVEAEVFAIHLKNLGVDPRHIFIENKAEHSTENVLYSMELASHLGFERIAVATDPMQSRMISFLLRKSDVEVDYLPADIATVGRMYWRRFDARIDASPAFVANFVPLKERENRKQRMKGTRGEKYRERMEEERNSPSVSYRP